MFYKAFIRNYFENEGNFDDISKLPLACKIRELADECHMSLEDYCYSQLGYADKAGILTPSDVFKVYKLLVSGNDAAAVKYVSSPKDSVRLKELGFNIPLLKMARKRYSCIDDRLSKYERESAKLIAAYYETDTTNVTKAGISFPIVLGKLKLEKDAGIAAVIEQYPECLVRFTKLEKKQKQTVCNREFKHTQDLTEAEKSRIQRYAIGIVLGRECVYPLELAGTITDVPFSVFGTQTKYNILLAYAAGRNITYADMAGTIGVNVTDQRRAVQKLGICVFKVADLVWIADLEGLAKMPYQEFVRLLNTPGSIDAVFSVYKQQEISKMEGFC